MDDCFLNLIYIMKKNILLLSFLCNFSLLLSAQTNVEKGLQSINRSSAEATINFLASDELQGREAGFHGSRVTSEYIVSLLHGWEYHLWLTAISSLLMLTVKNVRKKDVWKCILIP